MPKITIEMSSEDFRSLSSAMAVRLLSGGASGACDAFVAKVLDAMHEERTEITFTIYKREKKSGDEGP